MSSQVIEVYQVQGVYESTEFVKYKHITESGDQSISDLPSLDPIRVSDYIHT